MGKNTRTKSNESGKLAGKTGQHPGNKKPKRDGKPKKPEQVDHLQQIPFRLREILKSKERMKMGNSRTKKIKKAITAKARTEDPRVEDIPIPHFRRKKEETEKAYVRRMHMETNHVLFLTKNQVERKPELEEESQEKPADKGKSEKKKEYVKGRLQRLQQKKLDKQEDEMEKERFIDTVHFGEVAMAPPTLSAKPKKAPIKSQVSKGLLLNSLFGHTTASTVKPSMARQRIMEEERQRVVEAYRHLKKQKLQQQEERVAALKKLKKRK